MKPPSPADALLWEPAEGAGIPENPRGRRILVVEDDAPIREVLVTTLRLSGYRVAFAEDGDAVLAAVRAYKPELVLMDLMLPGTDGWELTAAIRDEPEFGNPPVIVLSARVREVDRQRAFDAGAVHFLPKPCRASDLLEVIRTFLGDRGEPAAVPDVDPDELQPTDSDAEELLAELDESPEVEVGVSGSISILVDDDPTDTNQH